MELGARGIHQVMIEGGAQLQSSMMRAGAVNELEIHYGAKMLGASAQPWAQLPIAETITEATEMKLVDVHQYGDDICARYVVGAQGPTPTCQPCA